MFRHGLASGNIAGEEVNTKIVATLLLVIQLEHGGRPVIVVNRNPGQAGLSYRGIPLGEREQGEGKDQNQEGLFHGRLNGS